MDNDEIARTIPKAWRKPARLAIGRSAVEQIGHAISKSLQTTLKADGGGCPGLPDVVAALDDLQREYSQMPLFFEAPAIQSQARGLLTERLADILDQHDSHNHTMLAADAARAWAEALFNRRDCTDPGLGVGMYFCKMLIRHSLFDRLRPQLYGALSMSYAEARDWERGVLDHMVPFLLSTVRQLLQDASGGTVTRPTRRGKVRQSTDELMAMNLL